jgi:hypothetical protein
MFSITLTRRQADLILFTVFLVFAIGAYQVTASFPSPLLPGYPGSAMFPRIVLVTMGVIAAFGVLRNVLTAGKKAPRGTVSIPVTPFVASIAYLCAFAALLNLLGMEVAVFAAIAGGLYYRTRSLLFSACFGFGAVVVVYLLFVQALSVHLPLLILPRYILGF